MKTRFVATCRTARRSLRFFSFARRRSALRARTGKSWLQLELADRTGTISAKMWDNFAALAATFERDDVIQIRGRVKLYNGQKELTIEQIVPAAERDYDLADFLPHTKYDVEKLYARPARRRRGREESVAAKIARERCGDPAIAPQLKRAPAAMTMHHAFIGGLLEHVVSLIGLGPRASRALSRTRRGFASHGRGAARHWQDRRAALRARHRLHHRRPACSATS